MKFLIASDIHGSAYWCDRLIKAFHEEKADRLVLLGDILYHGPRNDLPRDYAPKKTAEMLNELADRIICVRGNCDAEVDQMMLDFPVMADFSSIVVNDRIIFITHGHVYNKDDFPGYNKENIVISGHTHVPVCTKCDKGIFYNPGSVAIPKEGSSCGYMTLEGGEFLWKSFDKGLYASAEL